MSIAKRGLAAVACVALCLVVSAAVALTDTSAGRVSAGYAWATGELPSTLVNGQTYHLKLTLSGTSSAISGQSRTSPPRADQQAMDFTISLMVKNWNGSTTQLTRTLSLPRSSKEITVTIPFTPRIPALSVGKGEIWWAVRVSTPTSFNNVPFETRHVKCTLKRK